MNPESPPPAKTVARKPYTAPRVVDSRAAFEHAVLQCNGTNPITRLCTSPKPGACTGACQSS